MSSDSHSVFMLGTFGVRPKGTLSARAVGLASALQSDGWRVQLATTPWDNPPDAGRSWQESGVPVHNTRVIRPVLWPLAVAELADRVRHSDARLIHLFKPKGFGDLAARRLRSRYPVVVDMDDWEGDGGWNEIAGYGWLQRRLFDWQERSWPPQADAITVASRELERRALGLGAPGEKIYYLPNGLTRARIEELQPSTVAGAGFRSDQGLTDQPVILLYTRFVEFDPALIPPVLAEVLRAHPRARLVIAGGSPHGEAERIVHRGARASGIADRVHWLGWVAPENLRAIASGCNLAIHPFADTPVNRAKCSVKLLELMACGLPVVTTPVGENASYIEDGRNGALAPDCSAAGLARRASALLAAPARAREIGEAARERVRRDFSWERLAGVGVEAYRCAHSSRGGVAAGRL